MGCCLPVLVLLASLNDLAASPCASLACLPFSQRTVDKDRLRPMFKRKDGTHVMAGVLPVSLFASGHTFFVSRMAHLMKQHP